MEKIYGNFVEREYVSDAGTDFEFLILNFSPTSVPLQHRWRNNGLSADFLGDYLSTFFLGDDDESLHRRMEIKSGVGYIANELLENAMKFNYAPAKHSVSIGMELKADEVVFYVSNYIDPEFIPSFQDYIHRILTEDPNDLYMEKLMANEEDEGSSGVGYLTMINDWNAKLAWKFDENKEDSESQKVTTMVNFPFQ